MAERRIELDEYLRRALAEYQHGEGTPIKVYFQPPESLQISYPCLVYELQNIRKVTADNRLYAKFKSYSMTYITWWPDNDTVDFLVSLPMCSFDGQPYKSDNLYHYKFTIYY